MEEGQTPCPLFPRSCWVTIASHCSVVDVLALRETCAALRACFARADNKLWFALFRASCTQFPGVHDTQEHALAEEDGDDLLNFAELLRSEDWCMEEDLMPHAVQMQASLFANSAVTDHEVEDALVVAWSGPGQPPRVEQWHDPADYVDQWDYDPRVDWFNEAIHDAALFDWMEFAQWDSGEMDGGYRGSPSSPSFDKSAFDKACADVGASFAGDVPGRSPSSNAAQLEGGLAHDADRCLPDSPPNRIVHPSIPLSVTLAMVERRGLAFWFCVVFQQTLMGHSLADIAAPTAPLGRDAVELAFFASQLYEARDGLAMARVLCEAVDTLCQSFRTLVVAEAAASLWSYEWNLAHRVSPEAVGCRWFIRFRTDFAPSLQSDPVDDDMQLHRDLHGLMERGGVRQCESRACKLALAHLRDVVALQIACLSERLPHGSDVFGNDVRSWFDPSGVEEPLTDAPLQDDADSGFSKPSAGGEEGARDSERLGSFPLVAEPLGISVWAHRVVQEPPDDWSPQYELLPLPRNAPRASVYRQFETPAGDPRNDTDQECEAEEAAEPYGEEQDFQDLATLWADSLWAKRMLLENIHRISYGQRAVPSLVSDAALGPLSANPEMALSFVSQQAALRWTPHTHCLYNDRTQDVAVTTLLLLKRVAPFLGRDVVHIIVRLVVDGEEDVEETARAWKRMRVDTSMRESSE